MSEMNNFKKKLFDTIGSVADKTRDIAAKTADMTKDLTAKTADKAKDIKQIAKLALEISNQKDEIRDAYYEIGKLYYTLHRDDAEEDFAFLCNGITEAMQAIEEKTAAISELKAKIASDDTDTGDIEVEFEEVDFDDVVSASEGCNNDCACCCTDDVCPTPVHDEAASAPAEEAPAEAEETPVVEDTPIEETPEAEETDDEE